METKKQEDDVRYSVIVEIEDETCLIDRTAFENALREKDFKGNIHTNLFIAETSESSLGLVKKFFLECEEDFQPFAEAIITIPGVKNIKKEGNSWTRTPEEQQQFVEQQEAIDKEKELRREKAVEKREKDLFEYAKLSELLHKKYEVSFGEKHSSPFTIVWPHFDAFAGSIQKCTGEFTSAFTDLLAGGFMQYAHATKECDSLQEVMDFFTTCINDHLIPFVPPLKDIREIPLSWEKKTINDKKVIGMTIGCGKPTFIMAHYEFYIAQI